MLRYALQRYDWQMKALGVVVDDERESVTGFTSNEGS